MASNRYKVTRYKVDDLPKGVNHITLWKHYLGQNKELCTKTVIASGNECAKSVYLKYLASDGKYRFMCFDRNVRMGSNQTSLGNGQGIPTNLNVAVAPTYSLGYSSNRTIQAAVVCDLMRYAMLSDILTSPKVYLQTGETPYLIDDDEKNWIEVQVSGENTIPVKKGTTVFSITITLPEYNSITNY